MLFRILLVLYACGTSFAIEDALWVQSWSRPYLECTRKHGIEWIIYLIFSLLIYYIADQLSKLVRRLIKKGR